VTRQKHVMGAALCLVLSALAHGKALADQALIWTPSKTATDTYSMRMGARLDRVEAGAEVPIDGRKPSVKQDEKPLPVKAWGSVNLPKTELAGDARIDMNIGGLEGRREIALTNVKSREVAPGIWVKIESRYAFSHSPSAATEIDASTMSSVTLSSPATGTSAVARSQRSVSGGRWNTSAEVEQQLLGAVKVGAEIWENAAAPVTRFRASYRYSW